MNNLTCVIADDEPIARQVLREFIEDIPFLQLLTEVENVRSLKGWFQKNKADILFLDIEMPQKTGIQFLKENRIEAMVVFTTAYPQYALEGFDLSVLDYLVKPIPFERFLKAVEKAKAYMQLNKKEPVPNPGFIFVRSEKKIEKINYADILFIEAAGNYVFIHTEGKKIMAYLTLKSIEQQLPPHEFIKVHQSFVVRFSKIESIDVCSIAVRNHLVPIGRNYKEMFANQISKYMLRR